MRCPRDRRATNFVLIPPRKPLRCRGAHSELRGHPSERATSGLWRCFHGWQKLVPRGTLYSRVRLAYSADLPLKSNGEQEDKPRGGNVLAQSKAKLVTPVGEKRLEFSSMHIAERLSSDYVASIVAIAELGDIDESQILGNDCHVEIKLAGGGMHHFSGQASAFTYRGIVDNSHVFQLELRPVLWFLGLNRRFTIFQKLSVVEIVKRVFERAGLQRFRIELSGNYPELEYTVQYGESDFQFVQRLLEHHGIFYYFEHAPSGETIVLCDDSSGLKPSEPASLPFAYRGGAPTSGAQREEVAEWSEQTVVAQHKYVARDFHFPEPRNTLHTTNALAPQRSANVQEHYLYPGMYSVMGEGERVAKLRAELMKSARQRYRGTLNALGVRCGRRFMMSKHPRDEFNGAYVVVESVWEISNADHRSSSSADGWTITGSMEFQKADTPFRPPVATVKPVAMGMHTARVVGPPGEEIWSDSHGRVKVSFPWDRESTEDDRSSCFLRVMTPWGGPTRGFAAIPRIGDEVIVAFLDGDPDRPVVCGSVYNGENDSPVKNQFPHLALRSRSTKRGGKDEFNELRFEDGKGQERVYLQAQRDLEGLVKNDQRVEIRGNERRDVKKSRRTKVDAAEALEVGKGRTTKVANDDQTTVGKRIRIQAGDELDIRVGASRLTMKKDGTIKIEGVNVEVKAGKQLLAKGLKTKVEGVVTTEVVGLQTKVSGLMLDLKAGTVATLNGALVKIG